MGLLQILHAIGIKISVATIIILIGFIIAKLASRITKRVLAEAEINRILTSAGFKPLSDAIGSILEYVIYTITLLFVLQYFGLAKIVLGIILIIAIIALGFSLVLAFRDFIPNAIVGLFLRKKMKKLLGKKVTIGEMSGRLEHIGIVACVLKNKDEHYIPHLYTSKQNITRLRAS
jgi:small-conductance mechanosensitive channel